MSEPKRKGVALASATTKLSEKKAANRMSRSNRTGPGIGSRVARGLLEPQTAQAFHRKGRRELVAAMVPRTTGSSFSPVVVKNPAYSMAPPRPQAPGISSKGRKWKLGDVAHWDASRQRKQAAAKRAAPPAMRTREKRAQDSMHIARAPRRNCCSSAITVFSAASVP